MCVNSVEAKVVLSSEEYTNMRKVFSEGRIATMTDEELERYLKLDFNNIFTTQKYYRVDQTLNGTISKEVSEAEATLGMNMMENSSKKGLLKGPTHTTSYKTIHISISNMGGNLYDVFLYTEWLGEPNIKSFDVTGIRVEDAYVVSGSQSGTQTYKIGSTYGHVDYSYNGTNINNLSNGFGISMNLVDAASYFSTDITADVIATSNYARVFGAYQHAVQNVSLATSKSYTLNSSGLGNVFNFASGALQYYDNMQGVDIALPYSS